MDNRKALLVSAIRTYGWGFLVYLLSDFLVLLYNSVWRALSPENPLAVAGLSWHSEPYRTFVGAFWFAAFVVVIISAVRTTKPAVGRKWPIIITGVVGLAAGFAIAAIWGWGVVANHGSGQETAWWAHPQAEARIRLFPPPYLFPLSLLPYDILWLFAWFAAGTAPILSVCRHRQVEVRGRHLLAGMGVGITMWALLICLPQAMHFAGPRHASGDFGRFGWMLLNPTIFTMTVTCYAVAIRLRRHRRCAPHAEQHGD